MSNNPNRDRYIMTFGYASVLLIFAAYNVPGKLMKLIIDMETS